MAWQDIIPDDIRKVLRLKPRDDQPRFEQERRTRYAYLVGTGLVEVIDEPNHSEPVSTTPAALDQDQVNINRWVMLTFRQKEVFALLCRGLTNDQIAGELHIQFGTAKTHVERILDKLQIKDRVVVQIEFRDWNMKFWWDNRETHRNVIPPLY